MKKHYKIALIIFIVVVAIGLITNFVNWDETPLEDGFLGLFFSFGFMLQVIPGEILRWLMGHSTSTGGVNFNSTFFGVMLPLLSGLFCSLLYLGIARLFCKKKDKVAVIKA